jgi:hypothetical protein
MEPGQPFFYTQSTIKVQIPASTVVKVVVVGTVAAYFARSLVRGIDQALDKADKKNWEQATAK